MIYARKVGLVIISTFFLNDQVAQLVGMNGLLMLALALHLTYEPYVSDNLHFAEAVSLLSSILLFGSSVVFFVEGRTAVFLHACSWMLLVVIAWTMLYLFRLALAPKWRLLLDKLGKKQALKVRWSA